MNRALVILLVVVVVAGYLGTLIAQDPGYVLIAYGEYSMQTSLWVMLGLVLAITLLVYLALRVTGIIRRVPAAYLGWRGHQQTQRASNLTIKGQKLLAEGEYQRARKFLDSGALNNESQALNYLAAARAADQMGDGEARESYLRQAVEIDIGLSRARSVVAAELALARGEPEVALKMLKDTKSNDHILQIKLKSIQAASSWSDGLLTVPEIRKKDPAVALAIEKEAAAAGAMFIWVNSLAGVIARTQSGTFDVDFIIPLAGAVIVGGIGGSYLGAVRFDAKTIQKVMGAVVIVAVIFLFRDIL